MVSHTIARRGVSSRCATRTTASLGSRALSGLGLLAALLAAGCGAPAATQTGQALSQGGAQPSRTFVFIARSEPTSLGRSGGVGIDTSPRFFNATLMMRNGAGTPQPELAEKLPQLNTDSWRVLPDGRMETTYRIKPNLVWHDGEPFTANDLVFTWQVHRDPKYGPTVGTPGAPPDALMDQATAPDPLTFVVQWRQPYPKAGELSEDFRPLPRHVLETPYQQVDPEDWDNLPFWTRGFVGLGAYRVDQWEPGTFVEGAAFDRFLFGRPRIERLRLIFMQDTNAVAATLLSGAAHLVADITIRFETGIILKRQWDTNSGGTVLFSPAQVRFSRFQMRPEAANPRAIMEPNVHRAVAHAIDKQALADALYEGQGTGSDVFAPKRAPWFAAMAQAATKYPYDPRLAQAAMEAAGFSMGGDGFYARPGEGTFSPEWRATEGGDSSVQVGVLSDALRRIGIDAHPYLLRRPFDMQTRASFPALMNWSTVGQPEEWLLDHTTAKMATPDNRWNGSNFGGWSNLDYDRLAAQLAGSLDQSQRADLMLKLAKLISDELPVMPLYYSLDVIAHTAALRGVEPSPDGAIGWNIEKWELA